MKHSNNVEPRRYSHSGRRAWGNRYRERWTDHDDSDPPRQRIARGTVAAPGDDTVG